MKKKKEKKSVNKKKAALMAAAIIAAGGIGVGGAAAYFSATSATTQNNVSIVAGKKNAGNDDTGTDGQKGVLRITETEWKASDAQNKLPGDTVKKNPVIVSKAAYPGYIMAKVTVPTVQARLGNDAKLSRHDMFNLDQDAASKKNWVLVQSDTSAADHSDYYYAYQGTLAPDASTEDVFDSITEPDFEEVQAKDNRSAGGSVDVTAAIIQTTGNIQPTSETGNKTTKALHDALVQLTKDNNKASAAK